MKRYLLTILSMLIFGNVNAEENPLLGFWKSNEALTIESMRETEGITDKIKAVFEDNFFGKLIVEYRDQDFRAMYEDPKDNIDEFEKYHPYKILDKTDEYYLVESYDLLLNKNEIKKVYRAGKCYYVLISKWNFREYFCPI